MKKVTVLFLVVLALCWVGCAAHTHKIGNGAQTNKAEKKRQWYILYGAVPLNEVNTAEMANDTRDYTIKTELSPLDVVMNFFTEWVTVISRTVTVTK